MSQIKDLLKQISDTVSNDDLPKISGFLDSIGRQVVTLIDVVGNIKQGELLMFQNMCLEKDGKLDDALAHLIKNERAVPDKLGESPHPIQPARSPNRIGI
mgnify:CR=1 FL=1